MNSGDCEAIRGLIRHLHESAEIPAREDLVGILDSCIDGSGG